MTIYYIYNRYGRHIGKLIAGDVYDAHLKARRVYRNYMTVIGAKSLDQY